MFKYLFSIIIVFAIEHSYAQDSINQLDHQGKMHGVYRKFFSNGKLRYEGIFNHGKEIGTFKFYAETGEKNPIAIKEYNIQNDSIKVSFFNKTGKLESVGFMIGKSREGLWKYYFPDGKTLMSAENFKSDLLNGEVKTYYKNGQLTEVAHYIKGKLNGNRKRFAVDGKPVENINFKEGIVDGPAIYYDASGNKIAEGNYVDGLKKGEWKFLFDGEWISTDSPEKVIIKK